MKKLTLMIESCNNCLYCDHEKKAHCIYGAIYVNGDPINIPNIHEIMETCPLLDATSQDKIPAPIYYRVDKDGSLNIVIDTDA